MSYPAYHPYSPEGLEYQYRQDAEHLKLLSIFHYVNGGLNILTSLAGLIYVALGIAMLMGSHAPGDAVFGWMMIFLGAAFSIFYGVTGWLNVHAGNALTARKGYKLATVLSVINCLHVPTGTALGVFTLMVLNRPTVKGLFGIETPGGPPLPTPSETPTADRPWYQGQH